MALLAVSGLGHGHNAGFLEALCQLGPVRGVGMAHDGSWAWRGPVHESGWEHVARCRALGIWVSVCGFNKIHPESRTNAGRPGAGESSGDIMGAADREHIR